MSERDNAGISGCNWFEQDAVYAWLKEQGIERDHRVVYPLLCKLSDYRVSEYERGKKERDNAAPQATADQSKAGDPSGTGAGPAVAAPQSEAEELVRRLRDAEAYARGWTGDDNIAKRAADLIECQIRLSPLCEEHGLGEGTRSGCPYCALMRLQTVLSKIDYLCGPPNEMQVSYYDVHYNEDAVVSAVERLTAENAALRHDIERHVKALCDAAEANEMLRKALSGFLLHGASLGASHPHLTNFYSFPGSVWEAAYAAMKEKL